MYIYTYIHARTHKIFFIDKEKLISVNNSNMKAYSYYCITIYCRYSFWMNDLYNVYYIYHMRNKTKHTLRDRWLMRNIFDMICDPIDIRRVYKRRDRMIWKSIYDLLLSDGNFNRYALRHYNSVLSVCALFRIERFIFWRHVAILYGTRLFSYRYLVSQIHVKTFYIFPYVESGIQVPYIFDEYFLSRNA